MKRLCSSLAVILLLTLRVSGAEPSAAQVIALLDKTKDALAAEVATALRTNRYETSYTTVWRNLETDATAAFCAAMGHITDPREFL